MTVPHRVLGLPYSVNPKEPMSAPVAYTARSLVLVAAIVVGLGLIVTGVWLGCGLPWGLVALGAAVLVVVFMPSSKGGQQ